MNFSEKFQKDYDYGKSVEGNVLNTIQTYFHDSDITSIQNPYSVYDFKSKTKRFELKSRNNTKNRYATTMIGENKVLDASKFKGEYIFLFNFTDGLYYIKYDQQVFDTFEVDIRGRKDRGYAEMAKYVLIPVKLLKPVII
jgi:hypothetical protein